MTNTTKLTAKGLYSTDMRGKPMTANSYYKQISIINNQSTELFNLASLGFYKTGQLLNRAKKELKGDFGKLKKDLAEDGLHIKQQERYMAIARNKNIEINYAKLPPQWTFWEQLSKLTDEQFKSVEHLIDKDAKWKDLAIELDKPLPKSNATGYFTNAKDNRTEVFGLEYDFLVATKKHKDDFIQFEKEVKALAKKYSFIKLKKKNYFDEAKDMLNEKYVKDDTSDKGLKQFDKSYQSTKKIDI
ncbi:hypothetical protein OAR51_05170 [Candidatus Pseudothioglobus singularis]|jgi:hypothetical protein|nr:hypothetical protein [Candidatus Pseudothioglobus singularis]|tara:strand:+ start:242 stop:973 length:732 start_codon:yes stop_codon:yes gene_type:complete